MGDLIENSFENGFKDEAYTIAADFSYNFKYQRGMAKIFILSTTCLTMLQQMPLRDDIAASDVIPDPETSC